MIQEVIINTASAISLPKSVYKYDTEKGLKNGDVA